MEASSAKDIQRIFLIGIFFFFLKRHLNTEYGTELKLRRLLQQEPRSNWHPFPPLRRLATALPKVFSYLSSHSYSHEGWSQEESEMGSCGLRYQPALSSKNTSADAPGVENQHRATPPATSPRCPGREQPLPDWHRGEGHTSPSQLPADLSAPPFSQCPQGLGPV